MHCRRSPNNRSDTVALRSIRSFRKADQVIQAVARNGRKTLQMLVMEALNEFVVVTENGTSKRISKRQAAAKQLANKVAKGETASLKLLVQLLAGVEDRPEPYVTPDAREQLKAMLEKMAVQQMQDQQ